MKRTFFCALLMVIACGSSCAMDKAVVVSSQGQVNGGGWGYDMGYDVWSCSQHDALYNLLCSCKDVTEVGYREDLILMRIAVMLSYNASKEEIVKYARSQTRENIVDLAAKKDKPALTTVLIQLGFQSEADKKHD